MTGIPVLLAAPSVAVTLGPDGAALAPGAADLTVSSMIVPVGMAVGADYSLFPPQAWAGRTKGRGTLDAGSAAGPPATSWDPRVRAAR